MKLYDVVEVLPDGRERVLGEALSLSDARLLYNSGVVMWAGVIRER